MIGLFGIMLLLPVSSPTVELVGPTRIEMAVSDPATQRVTLRVMNRSKADVIVYSSDFWSNHSLRLTDAAGKPAKRTPFGERVERDFPNFNRGRNVPMTIPPGKERTYRSPELSKAYVLSPGEYRLSVVYKDLADRPPKPSPHLLELTTQRIVVVIRP
jgi:hypothetical protein